MTFTLDDKLKLYLRSSVGKVHIINPDGVYLDEIENKVSIFSGSFRYLASKIIKSLQTNNDEEISMAATPKDSIYCLKRLEILTPLLAESFIASFEEEINSYF